MSAENVLLATRIMDGLPLADLGEAFGDPERIAAMGASLEPLVDPDLEVVAVGPEYTGEGTVHRGLTGYLEFWVDWLEPWESFRIEAEEYLDAGDKVVMLARQIGSTETGGVPVESLGAAVMTFEDGRVTRIEFHLDRDREEGRGPRRISSRRCETRASSHIRSRSAPPSPLSRCPSSRRG